MFHLLLILYILYLALIYILTPVDAYKALQRFFPSSFIDQRRYVTFLVYLINLLATVNHRYLYSCGYKFSVQNELEDK